MCGPNYNGCHTVTHTFDLERQLEIYGELTVRVGLNVQPGQRLMIIGPLANGGASLEAAPLVRHITAAAYRAGAQLVETVWGDEAMVLARIAGAPRDSFGEFSAWFPRALVEHVEAGHAMLSIYANDPDLLKGQTPELVTTIQMAAATAVRPFRELVSRNYTNWAVVAGASAKWAAKVFPDVPPAEQVDRLWQAIGTLCRLDQANPIAAWESHLEGLARRTAHLNERQYSALKYTGPGTDLTIGLPAGHVWVSGRTASRAGIPFTANLPTEEVFTMPHKDRVEGTVRSTKPLSYGGTLIDGFSVTFAGGKIVKVQADRGQEVLQQLVDTDAGSARLGEIALVPHSSPISQSGVLFYNTLFDENAASHVALGSAYKFTMKGGDAMSDEDFARAGGNMSATHVDFMIGCGELDIDGVLPGGSSEPLMRQGEWGK
jgi:aminopeptidase